MICHGYDYTVPNGGKWLGKPMAGLGITNKVLQKAIAREMVDRLNTRLLTLANQSPRLTYVNCRGVVGDGRWHDELHPTNAGYADLAKLFEKEIKRLAGARAAPATRGRAERRGSAPGAAAGEACRRCPSRPRPRACRCISGSTPSIRRPTRAGTGSSPPASSTPRTWPRWPRPWATRPR